MMTMSFFRLFISFFTVTDLCCIYLIQVTKNRFDGVLGRVPLEFVRESLSMSGFGKQIQPNKTFHLDKRRPDKLKATRLAADVDVVKFSAPKIFGSNKVFNKNTVLPTPTNVDNGASTTEIHDKLIVEQEQELNNAAKMADKANDTLLNNEKKETVQKTVKKILSGTRLLTKAVPRNNFNRSESSQVNRKPNTTKIY